MTKAERYKAHLKFHSPPKLQKFPHIQGFSHRLIVEIHSLANVPDPVERIYQIFGDIVDEACAFAKKEYKTDNPTFSMSIDCENFPLGAIHIMKRSAKENTKDMIHRKFMDVEYSARVLQIEGNVLDISINIF